MYGLKIAKRPVRAKALIINVFALTGRIVFGGFLPQGGALGYVLLPLRGVLLRLLTHPLACSVYVEDAIPSYGLYCKFRSSIFSF